MAWSISPRMAWLRAEYFVRHLLGDHRWNANITELEREPPAGRASP